VWWTLFTVVDLYIGVVVLDAMAISLPQEKLPRLRAARKVIVALLVAAAIVLIIQVAHRIGWLRH
jgi:hypothetical protein